MNWFDWAKERLARWKAPEAVFAKTFTPRVLQVLALARKEAERYNHNFVGTEHVLLGLIKLGQGVAVNVLKNLGLHLENVREEIEKQIGPGPDQKPAVCIPYTPRVKKALEVAQKEAKALGHTYVGTEHLLLGLMSDSEGVAARVFKHFNVDIEQTRREILKEITLIYLPGGNGPKEQKRVSPKY
jgi:ATP-dependent Clp protease ATP-binding subunit ClpC